MNKEKLQSLKDRGKWRVKSKRHGWLHGSLCPWKKGVDLLLDVESPYSVKEEELDTIGQYTGMKDKNGKEIYEGDIVKVPYLDPIFKDRVKDCYAYAVIRFRQGSFVVTYDENSHIYLDDLVKDIEVAGNIYENSELLNPQ